MGKSNDGYICLEIRPHAPFLPAQCKSAQQSASHAVFRQLSMSSPLSPEVVPGPPALRHAESQCLSHPSASTVSITAQSRPLPQALSPLDILSSSPSHNPSPVHPLFTCTVDTAPHPFIMAMLFKRLLQQHRDVTRGL